MKIVPTKDGFLVVSQNDLEASHLVRIASAEKVEMIYTKDPKLCLRVTIQEEKK